MSQDERVAICRLTRTVAKLLDLAQARNSAEWQLLHQARCDLACVEKTLGARYCQDVPEDDAAEFAANYPADGMGGSES